MSDLPKFVIAVTDEPPHSDPAAVLERLKTSEPPSELEVVKCSPEFSVHLAALVEPKFKTAVVGDPARECEVCELPGFRVCYLLVDPDDIGSSAECWILQDFGDHWGNVADAEDGDESTVLRAQQAVAFILANGSAPPLEDFEAMGGADSAHYAGYGAFPGGDPRLFTPDEEVCTPEELEAHRAACLEADAMQARGEVPDWPSSHSLEQLGEVVAHVTRSMFGLGVYQVEVSDE